MTGHLSHSSPSTGNPLIWPAADRRDGDEQTTDAADHSRMHFNFPPCCVQSMASTRTPYSRKPEKTPYGYGWISLVDVDATRPFRPYARRHRVRIVAKVRNRKC